MCRHVSSKSIYYSVIRIPYKDRRHIGARHRVLRNVSKMADFCILKGFHKISTNIWPRVYHFHLATYAIAVFSVHFVFKISMFYMKINYATAIHCGVLLHGGSCLNEALVFCHILPIYKDYSLFDLNIITERVLHIMQHI